MSVRSGQSVTATFITSSPSTGAAANADSLPTGTLFINGTANVATVTITNIDTGRYKATVTLPALAQGDTVEISIAATVATVAGKGVIWRDGLDVLLDSAGKTTDAVQTGDSFARLGTAGAGLTGLGDARLGNLDAAVSSRSTYAGADTTGTTTLLGRVTGAVPLAVDYTTARAAKLDNLDATVSSRQATGGSVTLANGAITEATIATPGEAAGRPTGVLGMIRRLFEWAANKRSRDRTNGQVKLRNATDTADLETQTQSTASNVDTQG